MLNVRGTLIRLGDRLDIGEGWTIGVVVYSMDTGDYSPEYPEAHWAYLKRGILIETNDFGLTYYDDNSQELEIVDTSSV